MALEVGCWPNFSDREEDPVEMRSIITIYLSNAKGLAESLFISECVWED